MTRVDKLKGKKLHEKELFLSQYEGRDRIVSSHELSEELKETDESVFIIPTGVSSLDRILGGGVEAGELIVVTGPTGEGKTTLLMSMTKNMATAQDPVNSVWFTLEVTPRQFLWKLMKASQGDEEDENQKWEHLQERLPMFYLPHAAIDDVDEDYMKKWEQENRRRYEMIDWIEDRIIEAKVKAEKKGTQLKVVFIDHIHQIFSVSKTMTSISLEIGDMVARIKSLAVAHNLAVCLIAHSKDPEQGSTREPKKEDIRDSGLISRLADTILGVWRIKNTNDGTSKRREEIDEDDIKAKVRVFKNRRHGTLGFFTMWHINHYLTEEEPDAFAGTAFEDEDPDEDF